MIKVSVMYPNAPGARFDHDYYRDIHMPLVKERMGDKCKHYTIDKGLAGGEPGAPATYVGMCHIFCDSVEAFQAGFGPHAKEILADIANYTDQTPESHYRDIHMPLVKERMGDKCKHYTIDKGLAGGEPGAPATYVGMCHIFCDSVEAFQAGFGPHAKEILADIANYTDQTPVLQISEVVVG
ncbi:hypothetical protein PKB_5476 [Pseudomonas knackmussii B13]|uniref:EthD domain-containing protein n=1 Tax=Pseudomonas knackmussii (strain DSM 6978 / CCUG 54928 / LMG 23759 / B13) TaxID=1301098 RepID=A0A024HPJ3_PSEKB|nr:hypothetical protein PKB_5476 [Pseudomonas knackmussii B13]